MRCWECGEMIKECSCGAPRPRPIGSQYNTRQEEEVAEQGARLESLRGWLMWLTAGFIVLLLVMVFIIGGN